MMLLRTSSVPAVSVIAPSRLFDTRVRSIVTLQPVVDTPNSALSTTAIRLIVTRAWLRVDEVMKGQPQQLIALDLEGGTVGDLTLQVSDMPSMRRGERAVLFLDPERNGAFAPNGRGQGFLKLAGDHVSSSSLTLADVKARIRAALR